MDEQARREFEQWMQDCPTGLVVLTQIAISSIGDIREFMRQRYSGTGLFAYESPIDERQWLSYYRHRTLEKHLAELFLGDQANECLAILQALRNPHSVDAEYLLVAAAVILGFFMPNGWVVSENPTVQQDETSESYGAEVWHHSAMQFLLRITIPCWLTYGTLPSDLLADTWSGNRAEVETAIKQLVKLDPRAVRHPYILRWIESNPEISHFRREKVNKWSRSNKPFSKSKADSHYTKLIFSYVSRISELFDCRLESQDLKHLAKLASKGLPPDVLQYVSRTKNETIRCELGKKRKFFRLPNRPDRSAYESVRFLLEQVEQRFGHEFRIFTA